MELLDLKSNLILKMKFDAFSSVAGTYDVINFWNLSKTWKIVNEIINKTKVKTNIPPLATSTNASNPPDTVNTSNILNNYFVEIGPTLASSIPPTAQVPPHFWLFCHTFPLP